jgi:hypothetical protein
VLGPEVHESTLVLQKGESIEGVDLVECCIGKDGPACVMCSVFMLMKGHKPDIKGQTLDRYLLEIKKCNRLSQVV